MELDSAWSAVAIKAFDFALEAQTSDRTQRRTALTTSGQTASAEICVENYAYGLSKATETHFR